jgi:hypothetical protein
MIRKVGREIWGGVRVRVPPLAIVCLRGMPRPLFFKPGGVVPKACRDLPDGRLLGSCTGHSAMNPNPAGFPDFIGKAPGSLAILNHPRN